MAIRTSAVVLVGCLSVINACRPVGTFLRAGYRFAAVEPLIGRNPDVALRDLNGTWQFTISYVQNETTAEIWRQVFAYMWCDKSKPKWPIATSEPFAKTKAAGPKQRRQRADVVKERLMTFLIGRQNPMVKHSDSRPRGAKSC